MKEMLEILRLSLDFASRSFLRACSTGDEELALSAAKYMDDILYVIHHHFFDDLDVSFYTGIFNDLWPVVKAEYGEDRMSTSVSEIIFEVIGWLHFHLPDGATEDLIGTYRKWKRKKRVNRAIISTYNSDERGGAPRLGLETPLRMT